MNLERSAAILVSGMVVVTWCKSADAQLTERMSVDSFGTQGNSNSVYPLISADGRFVVFESAASNLVAGDSNGAQDIFVHDRQTGTTERVSVDSSGTQGNNVSFDPSISADGRFVAFTSFASNLVSGDTNGTSDVFVHDRQTGTTERVSVDSSGTQGNGSCLVPSISADGRFVTFSSFASNLVSGDTNGTSDIFVHDRQTGTTERVSVDSSGTEGNGPCYNPSISADDRFVAFSSDASNLVSGDTNGTADVFVHDRQTGTTERVSVDSSGAQGNGNGYYSSISSDGRFVTFSSSASNLVSGDTNGKSDVFVHDRQTGTTERVSVDSSGTQGNGNGDYPSISANGRLVAFQSDASNLVSVDTNGTFDIFVHDRQTGTTVLVSVDSSGTQGNSFSITPSISADGRFVAFDSLASNLVSGDTNGTEDLFSHGPYLTLEADPQSPPAGATLTFNTWRGKSNGLSLLAATDVNGTFVFVPVILSAFDANGLWTLSATVPSGLAGYDITFETFGIIETGKVSVSNAVVVSFQ
jgi:Tol biopolymer transport system component